MNDDMIEYENPTVVDAVFEEWGEPGEPPVVHRVPSGTRVHLPARLHNSIHQVQNGYVVGGMAPFLMRTDGKGAPVAPWLRKFFPKRISK